MSIELNTKEEFENWLDENYWLEDGYCLGLEVNTELNIVSLVLAYQIKGTYEANSERVRKVLEIIAEDVHELPDINKDNFDPEHCIDGIDLLDTQEGIKFSLDIPNKLDIWCRKLSVTRKEDLVDTVEPHVSEFDLFVYVVEAASIPKPETWVNWFKEDGVDLSWRYWCGEARKSSAIPEGNYEGWFLQEIGSIPTTSGGLFFQHLEKKGEHLGFHAHRMEFDDPFWWLFEKYLLNIEISTIKCGNCMFTRQEWENYLIDKNNYG